PLPFSDLTDLPDDTGPLASELFRYVERFAQVLIERFLNAVRLVHLASRSAPLADVREQSRRGRGVGQGSTGFVLVFAASERPVGRKQDVHVVVSVVAPPGAHSQGAVQPKVLPGLPQGIQTRHGLCRAPPFSRPAARAAGTNFALV